MDPPGKTPAFGLGSLCEHTIPWYSYLYLHVLPTDCYSTLAVQEYDTCIALLQNDRPLLNIADAAMTLPSSMKHWDAGSAYAWSSLQPMVNLQPTGPRLQPIIKSLLDGNRNVAETVDNERHRIVILLSLSRMMWSLKEVATTPMDSLIGDRLEEVRQKVQDTVDWFWQFPVSLSHTHTKTEVARSVHAMHIVHLAHIYGAGTLMNFYYSFLRNSLLQRTEDGRVAEALMKQWASENVRLARVVAFHCAQILALARRFPENMSMEPFLVFHAGVLLMTMGLVLPATQPSQGPGLKIDHLGPVGDPTFFKILNWAREGGNVVVGVHGVPVLCCETGWKQVLDETAEILTGLKVWKLTQALLKVVLAIRNGLDAN